jgi:hypothetical protein
VHKAVPSQFLVRIEASQFATYYNVYWAYNYRARFLTTGWH